MIHSNSLDICSGEPDLARGAQGCGFWFPDKSSPYSVLERKCNSSHERDSSGL